MVVEPVPEARGLAIDPAIDCIVDLQDSERSSKRRSRRGGHVGNP